MATARDQVRHPRRNAAPLVAAAITSVAVVAALTMASARAERSALAAEGPAAKAAQSGPTAVASLATADFDEDGVADLVTGRSDGPAGVITLYRGNADAIYPRSPAARARQHSGRAAAAPFVAETRAFGVPLAPDFLHAGDLDADGHADLIAAREGGTAVALRGDGTGSFGPAEPIALPGAVTGMVAGDINGPDGLPDIVFTLANDTGARLVVFAGHEGAWDSAPSVFELPARASAVAIRSLGDDHPADIAVIAGAELLVLHGKGPGSRSMAPAIERRPLASSADALFAEPPRQAAGPATLSMRLDADARDDLVTFRPGDAAPAVVTTLAATTRVVVNTNDSGPGSLRQAILDANADVGDDIITFNIPGPGPHVIVPATPLPPILGDPPGDSSSVIIDGTSEPDFRGKPMIELSGALVGPGGNGLTIASPGCVVRGLVINRFAIGLLFTTTTVDVSPGVAGGIVEGNYIGTDARGRVALANGRGVVLGLEPLTDPVTSITVGGTAPAARNVISGNGLGVVMNGGLNRVLGNFIGTDASGTRPLGNTTLGLALNSAQSAEIGGAAPGARNIVSANGHDGMQVHETGQALVRNNYIGTDVSGQRALGNGGNGIWVPDSLLTIVDNVISANSGLGILAPSLLSQVDVIGNRIGTNSKGTAALGNGQSGVESSGGLPYIVRGNVISGNGGHGVRLRGLENLVQQNRIGTDITGIRPIGNRGDGVHVLDFVNTIGGDGNGNVIAFNGGSGIAVALPFPALVTILSNAIHSNGGLGIDLGGDGLTPNDACDVDEQANAPVLTAVTGSPTAITVAGLLNSLPNQSFHLQFFASREPDDSGFGEGARLLGSATVSTDPTCNATFSVTLPVGVAAGRFITATATRPTDRVGVHATSEFSNALPFAPQTPAAAIRSLIEDVRELVSRGKLSRLAGFALTVKLRTALFFVERDRPALAAGQLRGFIEGVELLVRSGRLDPALGRSLIDSAREISGLLTTS